MGSNGLKEVEVENHALPGPINDRWRTWLMTGARRVPLDPRRLHGSHRGLKKILGEGLTNTTAAPYTWKDFSGAMVRHAVDDAMHNLPAEDTRVVKLAYFGGYSNREIAIHVGLTEAAVQRRLRRALAAISDQIQHGRDLGRRAAYAVGVFLTGRWLSDSAQHVWQAAAVAGAAVIIVATGQPVATEAGSGKSAPTLQAPATTKTVVPPLPSPTAPVVVPAPPAAAPVQVPSVQAPPLPLPSLPPLPVKLNRIV
ncbi:MAG TPA: sigma-70 family RNA polymerase sigma factor [Candidatus Dormibacteraeota bacterium]|nr:sigma-70 family RNA polymerase sigma factor [Candidatus Dormibacteraeota bacterium]